MPISPLDNVLANILGGEHSRPDQKAVSFRIDFNNYVKLCALQSITPKGVSRNQLLNDLLAVALDQVESSLLMVFLTFMRKLLKITNKGYH